MYTQTCLRWFEVTLKRLLGNEYKKINDTLVVEPRTKKVLELAELIMIKHLKFV